MKIILMNQTIQYAKLLIHNKQISNQHIKYLSEINNNGIVKRADEFIYISMEA